MEGRPKKPEGMKFPKDGKMPDMKQDGDTELKMWGDKKQEPHRESQDGETVTEFEIKEGENMFRVITTK